MPIGFVDCYGNTDSVKDLTSQAREEAHTDILKRTIEIPLVGIVIQYSIWKIFMNMAVIERINYRPMKR